MKTVAIIGGGFSGMVASVLAAVLLSLPRGKIHEQHGGWDRYIF